MSEWGLVFMILSLVTGIVSSSASTDLSEEITGSYSVNISNLIYERADLCGSYASVQLCTLSFLHGS